jgi:glycosyltransferase involved in cell wall biosynthesis
VSTDVGDVCGMVHPENVPYVTALGDDQAFREALASLVRDREGRNRLGRSNRARCIELYDLDVMVGRYRALHAAVLELG